MSPSNINSFVGDLVQMAKAMETLPQVEAENERLNDMVENYAKQVQALELRAIDRNAEISTLHDRIRSLEVERDDASFRVLEAEDVANSALTYLRGMQANMDEAIKALDPPKPEPVKEPEPQAQPVTTPAEGSQSVENPSALNPVGDGNHTGDASTTTVEKQSDAVPSPISELPGQSESSPIASGETSTETIDDPGPALGPYFGKRYINIDGYISRWEWNNGGGSNEDYDWRPSPNRLD